MPCLATMVTGGLLVIAIVALVLAASTTPK
jgi:hypothetical protein